MYQTKETIIETKVNNNNIERSITYTEGWFDYDIPSSDFHDATKKNSNPNKQWPFHTKRYEAE